MAKTDCYRDATLDAFYPRHWPAAAEIHLNDGQVLSTRVDFATGEPENPVSRAALIEKFVSLAAESVADPDRLAATILALDAASDLGALASALRGN